MSQHPEPPPLAEEVLAFSPASPDGSRGQSLCEVCEEVMTDDILPVSESPHGLELAICRTCLRRLWSGT